MLKFFLVIGVHYQKSLETTALDSSSPMIAHPNNTDWDPILSFDQYS